MTLTLHILSTGAQAGRQNSIIMSGEALTIGRTKTNDLVLPDPNREISSNHAVLQVRGTDFVVVDISTNGTFLNNETTPLGDLPSPLNNGDTLRIGPYELRVEISVDLSSDPLANLPPPLEDTPIMDTSAASTDDILAEVGALDGGPGDFLDDLMGDAPPNAMRTPTPDIADDPSDAINAYLDVAPDPDREGGASAPNHSPATRDFYAPNTGAGGIPDDWEDDFLSGDEDPFTPPASTPTIPEPPADAPVASKAVAPETAVPEAVALPAAAPSATPAVTGSGADLARKFLQAAGVNDAQITDDELADIMTRSGIVFKTLVEGAREVLMARASIKDELKLGQTMISPDGNNPIKFSISGQQAVEAMIKPTVAGYKLGPASAEEAMRDIKAHEIAMMSGMERAIQSLLGRFNPSILAQKLEDDGGVRGLLKGKKARYWEVFEKLYDQISEEAEEDFHSLFGKEFGKAYKEQMQKLKTTHGKET